MAGSPTTMSRAGNLALPCLFMAAVAAEPRFAGLIRGVSYGPVPLKSTEGGSRLPQDDWMAPAAKPMWGPRGRADLQVIKNLGANMIRLYGNNPDNDHVGFLNEAFTNGLKVAAGMSDWPYYQNPNRTMPEKPCKYTDYDCYEQVRFLYAKNLQNGFLMSDGTYHPAMAYMNVINEPDLKMPSTTDIGSADGPKKMSKAIISAFDGMLDAEKEAGMAGKGINFTATFSYAVCMPCGRFNTHPALGQIAQLVDAIHNPESYGYTPRNDLAEAYRTRWTHSFNTQNPARDLPAQFFGVYEREFSTTPVYIGEYHKPHINQTADLEQILHTAENSGVFLGISFFQYQEAYWKGGTEMAFGMFGLGNTELAEMPYFGMDYDVWCLTAVPSLMTGMPLSQAVATVYGGPYLDTQELCSPSPQAVPLDGMGFATISQQGKTARMAEFTTRLLQHLGGFPVDMDGLERFARQFVGVPESAFGSMIGFLVQRPSWTYFDPAARCVADRNADADTVAQAIGYVCNNQTLQMVGDFNCSHPVNSCDDNVYSLGDWVFSNYYRTQQAPEPLRNCDFNGAAMYASSVYYSQWAPQCVVGEEAPVSTVEPAVKFTPFNPAARMVRSGGEIAARESGGDLQVAAGPQLGAASSPGLNTADASSESQVASTGISSLWYLWLLCVVIAAGCVGYWFCGVGAKAKKSKKKTKRSVKRPPAELDEDSHQPDVEASRAASAAAAAAVAPAPSAAPLLPTPAAQPQGMAAVPQALLQQAALPRQSMAPMPPAVLQQAPAFAAGVPMGMQQPMAPMQYTAYMPLRPAGQ